MYLLYELRCFSRISSPEKGHTEHESKYDIFHVSSISPVSCGHVTRLSRHSVRSMNEWQGVHHSQSKVVRRNFLGIWLLKLLKDSYRQQTVTFEIFYKWKKTKPRKKNQKSEYHQIVTRNTPLHLPNQNLL